MNKSIVNENRGFYMAIAGLTGTRGPAVEKFIKDYNLDDKKLFNFLKKGKLKDRMNFASALSGKPGNKLQGDIVGLFGEAATAAPLSQAEKMAKKYKSADAFSTAVIKRMKAKSDSYKNLDKDKEYVDFMKSIWTSMHESIVTEGKKRFYQMDGIGKAKYTINFHDGKSKHKDGGDFYGIKIFKNKSELENFRKELLKNGYKEDSGWKSESINESRSTLILGVGDIDTYILKKLLMNNKKVTSILGKKELDFMEKSNVVVIAVSGKNYDFIFTDGKQEFEIVDQDKKLKHPLRKARPKIQQWYSKSINEGAKTVWKKNGNLFVDSDFVNFSKGKLPGNQLKIPGFGVFYLILNGGVITFMRHHEKFDGMSGISHTMTDDKGGKLMSQLIKKMGAKVIQESVNEAKLGYTDSTASYINNHKDEYKQAEKLNNGNEIKFYDMLQQMEDKVGHPKTMLFISNALRGYGVDMFKDPKIKNPQDAQEALFLLSK